MPLHRTCQRCGAAFSANPAAVKRGQAKFCSRDCADTTRRLQATRTCRECGATFRIKLSQVALGKGSYCSRACYNAVRADGAWITSPCKVCAEPMTYRRSQPKRFCSWACRDTGADWADPSKRVTTPCPGCGEAVSYYKAAPRKYCSNECAGRANVGNIPGFAPSAFIATCEQCGQSYQTTPAATRGRFCSRHCFGAWMAAGNAPSGPEHHLWRGGYDPYYGPSWRPARRAARLRDAVCQDCGMTPTQNGRALDVHHRIPFRDFGRDRHAEANALTNLVTLCPACHITREWATNWRQE